MIIKNGLVFCENGSFEPLDIYCRDDKIAWFGPTGSSPEGRDIALRAYSPSEPVIDAEGLYVVPGFVDIHTHGAMGHDFCDASVEGLMEISRHHYRHGITSFCPTSMTYSKEILSAIFQTVNDFPGGENCAHIAGINMEGPFIADSKKGAQNPAYIAKPDIQLFRSLNELCHNQIRLVTIAPEVPGSSDFIRELKDEVVISAGHSAADYREACDAFSNGVSHVTHLFNAMLPFHHREPGLIGATADHSNVMVEVICDGLHIHPSMIRNIYRIFGADRMILISDSMEATGMPDGDYELGGQAVRKVGNLATLTDQTLAGSATNLADCFRNAVSFGIPLTDALKMVTCNPANSIGLGDSIGSIHVGARADLLLLDKELHLVKVI